MTFWPKYLVSRQYSRGLYLEYPYPDDFLFRYLDSGQPLLRPAYTYITSVLLIIQIQTFMWQSEAGLRYEREKNQTKKAMLEQLEGNRSYVVSDIKHERLIWH